VVSDPSPAVAAILELASSRVPGHEASAALSAIRDDAEGRLGRVTIVEVVLDEGDAADLEGLLDGKLQKASAYLVSKRFTALGGAAALIALWMGDFVYVFESRALFRAVAEALSLDLGALENRLLGADLPGLPVALLPPPKN